MSNNSNSEGELDFNQLLYGDALIGELGELGAAGLGNVHEVQDISGVLFREEEKRPVSMANQKRAASQMRVPHHLQQPMSKNPEDMFGGPRLGDSDSGSDVETNLPVIYTV